MGALLPVTRFHVLEMGRRVQQWENMHQSSRPFFETSPRRTNAAKKLIGGVVRLLTEFILLGLSERTARRRASEVTCATRTLLRSLPSICSSRGTKCFRHPKFPTFRSLGSRRRKGFYLILQRLPRWRLGSYSYPPQC
jgi:hypothetical protein